MGKKLIKYLAIALAFVLIISNTGTAFAATGKFTKTVKGTKVILILPSEKAVIGDNEIKITLASKATKKIVTDSKVSLVVEMDAKSMGSMDMTEAKTVALKEGKNKGEYTGTVNFTDAGNWKLKISFTIGTGKKAKTYTTTFLVAAKESN